MAIPMNVLQSMMAINAQAIKDLQDKIQERKVWRRRSFGAWNIGSGVPCSVIANRDIRLLKHRISLLERNQRAMSQEMQELIFQAHVDKLTNVEYNDDLIYH